MAPEVFSARAARALREAAEALEAAEAAAGPPPGELFFYLDLDFSCFRY